MFPGRRQKSHCWNVALTRAHRAWRAREMKNANARCTHVSLPCHPRKTTKTDFNLSPFFPLCCSSSPLTTLWRSLKASLCRLRNESQLKKVTLRIYGFLFQTTSFRVFHSVALRIWRKARAVASVTLHFASLEHREKWESSLSYFDRYCESLQTFYSARNFLLPSSSVEVEEEALSI